ncbi:polysaccharide export outer membrane protein [Flavobacterium caeni]|uniref:Polysaccharide export outer membrane protein n=2 Tax=Flavobacterium caeni TaxID=490189 RepID=A0A1G5FG41_9FLAO|nr:polysaccharide export outer membrane protein [Flavobacterium caeni]
MKNYLCLLNFVPRMNKTILILLAVVALFSASCVPTKDLVYLQKKDKNDTIQNINPVVAKPYRLQPNDILTITIKAIDPELVAIFKTKEATQSGQNEALLYFDGYVIDDHGNIRMPILNEISVIGMTVDEVRQKIEAKLLEEYFNKEANIFVTVKLSGLRYTINGEVSAPGSKILYRDSATILEAIANAGDITVTGDRHHVTVIRQFPHGTEMHDIDLTDVKAMQSPYYYLRSNDYIYVKPLPQKSWGTGRTGIESLGTILSVLTLITTTLLLLNR